MSNETIRKIYRDNKIICAIYITSITFFVLAAGLFIGLSYPAKVISQDAYNLIHIVQIVVVITLLMANATYIMCKLKEIEMWQS